MTARKLTINGRKVELQADAEMPLLWALRDVLDLTGTKYGCGVGLCGACTVLDGDRAVRSCQLGVGAAEGHSITTIEGLSDDASHPIQKAWLEEDVAQCGYCQPAMILAIRALLRENPDPTPAEIDAALSEHVCRCGSYPRIRKAALRAARLGGGK